MTSKQINLKLAEVFGIHTKDLVKFSLHVVPGEFPVLEAEYIVFDSPKILVKKHEIESIKDANA